MPIFGQFLVNIVFVVNVIFLDSLPFEMLFLEFINELCGSFVLYYLAAYSYMADVTTEGNVRQVLMDEEGLGDDHLTLPENRTARLSVLDGTDYIFTMVGTYLSGPIFKHFGYLAIFIPSGILSISAVLYIIFFVKESQSRMTQANLTGVSDEREQVSLQADQKQSYGTNTSESHQISRTCFRGRANVSESDCAFRLAEMRQEVCVRPAKPD